MGPLTYELPVDAAPRPSSVPVDLAELAQSMRRDIIERSFAANVGHIGSALSVTDILAALWGRVLRKPGSQDPDRDIFVLAKGHAALALYSAMYHRGVIGETELASYCRDGSPYGAHPEYGAKGIDLGTGSLGQGLSVACGMALSRKMRGSPSRVYCLVSDAECNEGQVWEAAQFAAHHGLDNLAVIVDLNGMQAMGRTEDILDAGPLSRRWAAFDWHVEEVNGHAPTILADALEAIPHTPKRPTVVIAHTHLGAGVSFMEDRLEWHYRNLSADLHRQALAEIDAPEKRNSGLMNTYRTWQSGK